MVASSHTILNEKNNRFTCSCYQALTLLLSLLLAARVLEEHLHNPITLFRQRGEATEMRGARGTRGSCFLTCLVTPATE